MYQGLSLLQAWGCPWWKVTPYLLADSEQLVLWRFQPLAAVFVGCLPTSAPDAGTAGKSVGVVLQGNRSG